MLERNSVYRNQAENNLESFLSIHSLRLYYDYVKYKIRICLISQSPERTFFNIFAEFTLQSILSIYIIYLSKKGGAILIEGNFWNRTDAKYMRAWVDAYSVEYASTDKFGRWIIRAYNSDG